MLVCNFADAPQAIAIPFHEFMWSLRLWSGDARYGLPRPEPRAQLEGGDRGTVELAASSAALYVSGRFSRPRTAAQESGPRD